MSKITVENPELVKRRTVDSGGRVYVGRDYEDEEFRVILERIEDDE